MYKFDFGNFKFGYSTDAAFDTGKLAWLDDCDLIMHDTWFGEVKGYGGDIRNLHSPIADLLTMPRSSNERRCCATTPTAPTRMTRRNPPRRSASTA